MDGESLYKLDVAVLLFMSWIACQVGELIEAQFINKLYQQLNAIHSQDVDCRLVFVLD